MPLPMMTGDLPQAQFKILTGVLKAFQGDDGRKRISGIASSTVRDLHGDIMNQSAISDMERMANDNLTIFLNHSYQVPEDVFGSVEKATAVQRGMDGDGNPTWDLIMDILVDDENPRAEKAFKAIGRGVKLGLSIGALIPKGGAEVDKDTGTLTINHVHLLETSVVSIPANPRSWISNAVKAIRKAATEANYDEDGIPLSSITLAAEDEDVCRGCGGSKRKPKDGCDSSFHKSTEVEAATAADESISSQEAPVSEPESEAVLTQAVEPDLAADIDPALIQAAVVGVSAALETLTAKLVSTEDELQAEKALRQKAEAQADEASQAAREVIAQVRIIVERIGQTPLGKKTSFAAVNDDLSHLEQVYSAPFLKLLKQGDTR
jgi:HK97 family phage prohead protease